MPSLISGSLRGSAGQRAGAGDGDGGNNVSSGGATSRAGGLTPTKKDIVMLESDDE